jgi:hypothetical protein
MVSVVGVLCFLSKLTTTGGESAVALSCATVELKVRPSGLGPLTKL